MRNLIASAFLAAGVLTATAADASSLVGSESADVWLDNQQIVRGDPGSYAVTEITVENGIMEIDASDYTNNVYFSCTIRPDNSAYAEFRSTALALATAVPFPADPQFFVIENSGTGECTYIEFHSYL